MIDVSFEERKRRYNVCAKCNKRNIMMRSENCYFDWIDCPFDCENDYEHLLKEMQENKI